MNNSLPDVHAAPQPYAATIGHIHQNGTNGHVNALDRAQSEPYAVNVTLTGKLADDHRATLKDESGLSDEAIAARGYWTCDGDKATLRYLGLPGNIGRCLVVPLFNHRGERVGHVARPDIPILKTTGKPQKYLYPKDTPQIVDVSPLTRQHINDPHKPLVATEGAKKADAAAEEGFPAINLNGVFGFRGTNEKGGLTTLAAWDEIAFEGKNAKGERFGRVVLVCFDSDVAINPKVENALRRFSALAAARGAIVKVVQLETCPNGEKTGLDDFFARDGGTREKLLSMARDLESVSESKRRKKAEKLAAKDATLAARGLPEIATNDRQLIDELQDLASALAHYNESPTIFHGIGGLKEIGRAPDGELILESVGRERLQVIASKAATWYSMSEREGKHEVDPPAALCQQFLVSPELWQNIPRIKQVVTSPFVDRHGNICATHGYHESEQVWLSLPDGFVLPDTTPTPANIEAAKALLNKLLGEVAFADDASLANAMALMILPAVRRMIPEQTPMHLADAPVQNSGKTYLMKICLSPYCEAVPTSDKADQKESQKEVFALLVEGVWYIFIDNVKSSLGSPEIATAITSGKMRGRILGATKTEFVNSDVVWVATSNNAQLDADIVSRCIVIRLDTNLEDPDTRKFAFNPLDFVSQNRAQVLGAIFTIVRAWLEAGQPGRAKKISRFPAWEKIVGGILETAGIEGFLENHIEARNLTDPESQAWRAFIDVWFEKHQDKFVTVKDLLAIDGDSELLALIGEKDRGKRFGKELQKRRDKVISGKKITRKPERMRVTEWRLVPVLDDGKHSERAQSAQNAQSDNARGRPGKITKDEKENSNDENAGYIEGLEHCAHYALCADVPSLIGDGYASDEDPAPDIEEGLRYGRD